MNRIIEMESTYKGKTKSLDIIIRSWKKEELEGNGFHEKYQPRYLQVTLYVLKNKKLYFTNRGQLRSYKELENLKQVLRIINNEIGGNADENVC